MKNRKLSKIHKQNIAKSHIGIYQTEKSKQKLRIKAIKRLSNPKNNPFYGKHHTTKSKLKMSRTILKLELHKGKKNGRWIDGRSYEPYTSNFKSSRESIRKRDSYKCQKCGIMQHKHLINNKKEKLSIHHIDYNKHNCNPKNLITLCRKCNSIVNTNRDYWYAYFTYIMENR
jgi:hypothetical protein